ncbi:hypothetical protein CsSME_00029052 [Camellia sinensis var. sinensis]
MRDLGIRSLVSINLALLGKWLWWTVVRAKYGLGWGDWSTGEVIQSHEWSLWKGIWLGQEDSVLEG